MEKSAPVVTVDRKTQYSAPSMKKHEPIKIVQGTGDGCSGYLYYLSLYHTSLYYWW